MDEQDILFQHGSHVGWWAVWKESKTSVGQQGWRQLGWIWGDAQWAVSVFQALGFWDRGFGVRYAVLAYGASSGIGASNGPYVQTGAVVRGAAA